MEPDEETGRALHDPGSVFWAPGFEGGPDDGLDDGAVFDCSVANIARVYDYWLGGKDNYQADREAGDAVAESAPWIVSGVRANRSFLCRAVKDLALAGVDQFVDIGSGLPTARNVHEVAQAVNPAARVVYVDNDVLVATFARALLATDERTVAIEGDAREPARIIDDLELRGHIDWARPVAVLFVAVLHFLTDDDDPGARVATFREVMTPGSHLVISHVTPGTEEQKPGMDTAVTTYRASTGEFTTRTREQITRLFDGFDLIPPGLVGVDRWRAWSNRPDGHLPMLAGVGRLPEERPSDVSTSGGGDRLS